MTRIARDLALALLAAFLLGSALHGLTAREARLACFSSGADLPDGAANCRAARLPTRAARLFYSVRETR